MNKVKLNEVTTIIMGQSPSSDSYNEVGNGLPFYQGKSDFGELYPTARIYCNQPKKIAEPYDILMSVRAPVGDVNIADTTCCIGRGICAIRANEQVNYKYIYYYLKTIKYQLELMSTGSTFKAINKSVLDSIEINIPNLKEQERIVSILEKSKSAIQKRKECNRLLDELVKSRFIEMFGDPVLNTKGWEKLLCKDIMLKIGSGATPKGGNSSYKEEGISLIRSMNVHNNKFIDKDLAFIDDEQAEKLKNVIIEENDVLLNITGASVARCCIVPNKYIPARVNQHVAILRCKCEQILHNFLCYQLTNESYQRLLWDIATSGGATREAITKQQIENLEIIVPPVELQNQFADFVNQVDKLKFEMETSLKELENNFNSLMQKAFKGELI